MFKIFDKNGDGFISVDEMKKLVMYKGIHEAEINEDIEWLKKLDKDGDSKVSFEEFKTMY